MRYLAQALTQPYMDLALRSGGYDIEIIEFPGRWMSDQRLAALTQDLRQIAGRTLPAGDLTYGVFSGDAARLKQSIITLVKSEGRPIAFNALVVLDLTPNGLPEPVLHLGLVMVDPDLRSKGLSWILYGLTCVLLFIRGGLRPIYISNVTQVPSVVGLVSEIFSQVYPNPTSGNTLNFQTLLVAREIMQDHRHVFGVGSEAGFDPQRFVITNAYTGGSDHLKKTFEQAPKHRNPVYNSFCAEQLDYDRGDDVLQIGLIDLNAARNYVAKAVPKGSALGLLALGALVVLRRVIQPVLQWFNTSRQFGPLRPLK